ncbi:hypothetical protein [Mesorhizobium wenxiniae]|uniref:hypothetical protein n=1 Tax=Mesorhizobium wenxiniae TaxID=2014805 RepID=UPI0010563862|nr:hypothetical protein [Mesorhizobium wenxiniae]
MKDVIDVHLMAVDSDAPLPAMGKGAAMMMRHRQLYRATAFVRRYTQPWWFHPSGLQGRR